ncbi:hypothetical protein [Pedobacter agri]|uniref:hypothetical protein n=1 Tax=Pedobacter agri TaxID=454586 RepID=UPI0029307D48|nr:hypothetical protein [Pedobacter agri]
MFRKIHFRLADKRFLSEVNVALGPIWNGFLAKCRSVMVHHPRKVFAVMILSIGVSLLVLAKDIFALKEKEVGSKELGKVSGSHWSGDGFYEGLEGISATAAKMRQNLMVSKKIDTLLGKDQLSPQDSIWLLQALKTLER